MVPACASRDSYSGAAPRKARPSEGWDGPYLFASREVRGELSAPFLERCMTGGRRRGSPVGVRIGVSTVDTQSPTALPHDDGAGMTPQPQARPTSPWIYASIEAVLSKAAGVEGTKPRTTLVVASTGNTQLGCRQMSTTGDPPPLRAARPCGRRVPSRLHEHCAFDRRAGRPSSRGAVRLCRLVRLVGAHLQRRWVTRKNSSYLPPKHPAMTSGPPGRPRARAPAQPPPTGWSRAAGRPSVQPSRRT